MAMDFDVCFADAGKILASFVNLNAFGGITAPLGAYKFTTSAITTAPTAGATYTNNGITFTVLQTMAASGTVMVASGIGAPAASGTLTKATGTGDATVTFSAVAAFSNWGTTGPVIKSQLTMVNDILARLELTGLTSLIPFGGWQGTMEGIDTTLQQQKSVLAQLLQAVIIKRVNNDVAQQNSQDFTQAMTEWIRQMRVQSKSVAQATVSSTTAAGSGNTGTATVYGSITDPNGLTLENAIAETLQVRCTQDQFTGAEAGSEIVSISSPQAALSNMSYLWPGGSGILASVIVTDPEQGNGAGQNLVTGSTSLTTVGAFKAWTGTVPDAWLVDVDGANIADGTSNAYAGEAHCLKFIGNTAGTNLNTALYQTFANGDITTGSTQTILPNTVYHFYAKVKADVVPAAGVVQFSLTDGSGTVLNNNAGAANTITSTISGFGGTTYQTVTGTFQTPTIMPTNVRLRIKASTPITTGTNVFIDYVALAVPAVTGTLGGLYAGGPYLSVFRGNVDLVNFVNPTIGDSWTVAVANNYANSASPTILSFNMLFNQLLGMSQLGFVLPVSGSPTAANSLIC